MVVTGGDVVDCGALCLPGLAERVHELVHDAVASGARLVAGGAFPENGAQNGQYYPPTVLADVTQDMRVFQEEVFGPVMCISRFSDDDEAVCCTCPDCVVPVPR